MELEGMEQIMKRVEEMGKAGERAENKALKEAGNLINEEIKDRAPTSSSPRQPKGKTQMWRTGQHAKELLKVSGVRSKNGMKYAFYLKFKEFGSSKEAAHPFMGPAYESKKEEAKEVMKEELRKELGL